MCRKNPINYPLSSGQSSASQRFSVWGIYIWPEPLRGVIPESIHSAVAKVALSGAVPISFMASSPSPSNLELQWGFVSNYTSSSRQNIPFLDHKVSTSNFELILFIKKFWHFPLVLFLMPFPFRFILLVILVGFLRVGMQKEKLNTFFMPLSFLGICQSLWHALRERCSMIMYFLPRHRIGFSIVYLHQISKWTPPPGTSACAEKALSRSLCTGTSAGNRREWWCSLLKMGSGTQSVVADLKGFRVIPLEKKNNTE